MSERSMTWMAWALSVALLGVGLWVHYEPTPETHRQPACLAIVPGSLGVAVVVREHGFDRGKLTAFDVYGLGRPSAEGQVEQAPNPSGPVGEPVPRPKLDEPGAWAQVLSN